MSDPTSGRTPSPALFPAKFAALVLILVLSVAEVYIPLTLNEGWGWWIASLLALCCNVFLAWTSVVKA